MTPELGGGLLLALASAAALNWGYFVQHGVASELPPLTLRRPVASLKLLFGNLSWLVGFLVGIGGWVLYVAALALAPLSLVQAASAGGIGLLALLVSRTAVLTRWERRGIAVSIGGLALLGASLTGQTTSKVAGAWPEVVAWVAVSIACAGLAALRPARWLSGGAGLGIAAGILYSAGDVSTKAAVPGGASLAFAPVLLTCHGLAFVALPARLPARQRAGDGGPRDAVHERAPDRRGDNALRRGARLAAAAARARLRLHRGRRRAAGAARLR